MLCPASLNCCPNCTRLSVCRGISSRGVDKPTDEVCIDNNFGVLLSGGDDCIHDATLDESFDEFVLVNALEDELRALVIGVVAHLCDSLLLQIHIEKDFVFRLSRRVLPSESARLLLRCLHPVQRLHHSRRSLPRTRLCREPPSQSE